MSTTVEAPSPSTATTGPLFEAAGLRSALENVRANILLADREFNLVYANPAALATLKGLAGEIRESFGVEIEDLLGASIHRFHKDPGRIERILLDPSSLPHEATFSFGRVTLRTDINSVKDDAGEVVGYIVNWDDVSEEMRRKAEMARIHSMMENSPTNVMYADRDLVIRYLNPASTETLRGLEHLLPIKVDEIVGTSVDVFHKAPEHQRKLLSDPSNLPIRTNIQVGPGWWLELVGDTECGMRAGQLRGHHAAGNSR